MPREGKSRRESFGPNPLWLGGGAARLDAMEVAYVGVPPWDIGRPQAEVVRLEEEGSVHGAVLDAGCGTGDNALYLSELGHPVLGIDAAPRAVERARARAREQGLTAEFRVADALALHRLGRCFDTVIDCGLFHGFSDEERTAYARSLAAVMVPGGTVHILCFSEWSEDPGRARRVSQTELRSAFRDGWDVASIREATIESRLSALAAPAWLAMLVRASSNVGSGEPRRL